MDLHHRSCVLPSNAPALSDPEPTIPSRVLRENSGNRGHTYLDSFKRSPPSSPLENICPQNLGANYYPNNGYLHGEKSDKQINSETKRLWDLLQRCDKYQKYRDRQPQPAKEKEQRWPDELEFAFFRGLVRWPPMGRRKQMLDGQLRGRNELVADSIQKDTGINRTRKQVSSHIQVLKNILSDQPQLLVYMSTDDLGGRKRASHSHSHLRSRHASLSRYGGHRAASAWNGYGSPHASRALGGLSSQARNNTSASFSVTHFTMRVRGQNAEHNVTQLGEHGARQPGLHFTDLNSWHSQYPEFNFHRTEDWKDRSIIICDASMKIMTRKPAGATFLDIEYVVKPQQDLSAQEPLQCRTRFYDSGKLTDYLDKNHNVKTETFSSCDFMEGAGYQLKFASPFWVERLNKLRFELQNAQAQGEQMAKSKGEISVRRSLQCLTATQDIFAVKEDTGEQHCILTILWRFDQTRSLNEPGKMKWRVAEFASPPPIQYSWPKNDELESARDLTRLLHNTTSGAASSIYPSISLDAFQQPAPLDLDALSGIPLETLNDFSNPTSATAPSLATDYSQTHSLPSLTHSQDTAAAAHTHDYHDAHDIDFNGDHMNLHLPEPNLSYHATYDTYSVTQAPSALNLHTIASLDPHPTHHPADTTFSDLDFSTPLANCYPSKPWTHYHDVISRMEGAAAEQSLLASNLQPPQQPDVNVVGHGVLHDGQLGSGIWKLQSPFPEDVGGGADDYARVRGDGGLGILELIERDGRRDSCRGY